MVLCQPVFCSINIAMFKFCSSPWDSIQVRKDGQISSCLCPGWHKLNWDFGNLNDEPLSTVFNQGNFIEMRQSIMDQSFRHCNQICYRLYSPDQYADQKDIPKFPNLPTEINLAIDSNCNLECRSCRNSRIYSKDIDPQADKILNNIVDTYRNFEPRVRIYADATGDVFASSAYRKFFLRDDLPTCFEFCIQTNGNLITKNKKLIERIHDKIDIVIVSFDAATDDTYKKIRGGKFQQVLDGVKLLIDLGIQVHTQFVVQQGNYLEIPDYIKLAKSLGVEQVGLYAMTKWIHMKYEWWKRNRLFENPGTDFEFLADVLIKYKDDPQLALCGNLKNFLLEKLKEKGA